jgi:energy-coupling factor transporter ATP-binding protein EcfA2
VSALHKLTITNFRGAIRPLSLRFDPGAKLTVVYGENASGKSTICDALELLSRGRVGSLENRGLGTATSRYWPSLGSALGDISIILESAGGECSISVSRIGEVVSHSLEERPRVEVFRRNQILALVEAKPGERYAAISRFIDVSTVEASEASLRELIRDLKKQRDGAAARFDENEIMIRQFWETAGSPAPDAFAWAEAESKGKGDAAEAEINAIRALQTAYLRLSELPGRLRAAQQSLTAARNSAEAAVASVREKLENTSAGAIETIGLLEAANTFFARHPSPTACPLCESTKDIAGLADRIKNRMEGFLSLRGAQELSTAATESVKRAEQHLELLRESARQDVAKFEACRSSAALPTDVPVPNSPVPNSASGLTSWLTATAALNGEWKKAEMARHDRRQFVSTLRQALETSHVNRSALHDLDQLLPRLERTLKVVEGERRHFTDDLLTSIAAEVSRLYEVVHPGEGLNRIRLELDPKKRASLEIGASFSGQPTRPQGYFSESHLETLGLCVFLALAALDQPEGTVLVLDDVLSSVDDLHTERLLKLLSSESQRFRHCILTTHNRPSITPTANIHYIEMIHDVRINPLDNGRHPNSEGFA